MKRHFDLLILFLLLLSACATTSDPVGAAHTSPQQTPERKILTVAVLEFEDHGFDPTAVPQGLGRTLTDRTSEQLLTHPEVQLIDRESLQKTLEELSLASLDITDRDTHLRLGRLLGAQYLIMGGYMGFAGGLRIDGRIVEVERGIAEGISLEGQAHERVRLENDFAKKMADLIRSKAGGTMWVSPQSSHDFFLQGLALEQSKNTPKALEMYQKALALDPLHPQARERMDNLLLQDLQ